MSVYPICVKVFCVKLFCVMVWILSAFTVSPLAQPGQSSIQTVESEHPHHLFQYDEDLFSGSVPDQETAFERLQQLGIKTIISVDGAKPKLDLAKQYGMRYVHIPVQYREITPAQSLQIAKAVRDLTPPLYIHCHHGKHRGPAAAALAMVMLGKWENPTAILALETTGTGKNYTGLYQTVSRARKVDNETLDRLAVEFVESADVTLVVKTMVQLQTAFDRLKAAQQNHWRAIREKEIDPAHEAMLMRELFYEFNRTGAAKDENNAYRSMVTAGEGAAQSLEKALRDWSPLSQDDPPKALDLILNRITRNCAACHTLFRNTPR